jgi:protein-S-isoprenylcysteine O-methyltransferase Ste14
MFWPVIPLFWIPVHFATKFFKRLGYLTYIIPVIGWLPFGHVIYHNRAFILQYKFDLPVVLNIAGIVLLIAGTLVHIWTGRLLGIRGLIGISEIAAKTKGGLVTQGAFSVVRNPTYLAHTIIFTGIFLFTEVIAAGVITVLDFLVKNTIIIPLEEKELLKRFGEKYKLYKNKVPAFFPRIHAGKN